MEVYTYTESLSKSIEYFNGDELAARVFCDKYALRNEKDEILEDTPEKMHWRMAKELARIEKNKFKNPLSEQEIFSYFDRFKKIIPQGSMMFGIGNYYHYATLSNCYVIDPPTDSYGGICKTDEQLVQISKRRGGNGTDISHIRPAGMSVKNSSRTTTGIIPFMRRFSNSIREVGQGGRRGALMLTISIHHPQVLDFASIKKDKNEVTGANISIRLTDEFLNAVDKDLEYEQRWPVDSKEPKISIKVKAKDVWREIIKNAHNMAEPGLLFWDTIIKESPADCYENYKTISTNPCQPSWAKLLTKEGIRQLKDIKIGDEIWSKEGWTKIINKWSTGIKKVYEYRTTAGCFYGTENHKLISNGEKIEAQNCESVDIFAANYTSKTDITLDNQDIMDGLVLGDGTVHKASNNLVHLCIGQDDMDYFESEIKDLILKHRPGLHDYAYLVNTTITASELPKTFDRVVPDRFYYGNKPKICAFLRGLYSANGSVCGSRITLKSASFNIIEQVQTMLSSIGIRSYYTTNKPSNVKFSNGEYLCRKSYDLNISTDRNEFYYLIGFIQDYKNQKVFEILSKSKGNRVIKKNYDIISDNFVSEEEVFDITVDNNSHTYWTQGCNVSNCSELPLSVLDSCRLIVINLLSYVENPYTDKSKFNYELFTHDCKIMQRLIDDAIDLELEHIDRIIEKINKDPEAKDIKQRELDLWTRIRENCFNGRRTGSGITGLGDTLAALNIKYGSDESFKKVNKIYKALKLACYWSSVEMAKELGAFPVWNHNLEKDNPFLLRIKDDNEDLWKEMKKYGRRNIAILTTAPTGTVSLLTQTSSGIEPVFQLSYTRRKKITHEDRNAKIDFVDNVGDKWQEFIVYHPQVKNWMEITKEIDVKKSPWYNCCAEDLNWPDRVKLQSIAQKHIDHAISSTLNLPENVSVNKVAEIYESAWKSGCKGITIYRKNCRTGVLIDNKEEIKNTKIPYNTAPKRPKKVNSKLHYFTVKGEKYYVAVGFLDKDEPYEIFTGFNQDKKAEYIPKEVKDGIIIKNGRGDYVFIDNLTNEEYKLLNGHSDEAAEALTRMISCALRHGSELGFIVHQLEKTKGDLMSFSKCLARTLKYYIKDGTKITGENCQNCGSSNIQRDSGCSVCKDCGNSKCQ